MVREAGRDFTPNRGCRVRKQVKQKEGKDGREIEAKQRRDDSSKQIQVRVRQRKHGLEHSNPLRLGKPTKKNTRRDDEIVNT
jgi:hypothetical protein